MSTFFLFILSFHFVFKVKLILFDSVKSWDWLTHTVEMNGTIRECCLSAIPIPFARESLQFGLGLRQHTPGRDAAQPLKRPNVEQWNKKQKSCWPLRTLLFLFASLQGLFYCRFSSLNFFLFLLHTKIFHRRKERKKNFRKHFHDRDIVGTLQKLQILNCAPKKLFLNEKFLFQIH